MWLRDLPTASASASCWQTELVEQALIALGLLDRVEVLALEVLDEGGGERVGVAERADEARHLGEAGRLGGAPAALAGDDLEAGGIGGMRAHQDGLEDAAGADRFRELGLGRLVHAAARLERVRARGRRSAAPGRRRRAGGRGDGIGGVAHQGGEAAAEAGRFGLALMPGRSWCLGCWARSRREQLARELDVGLRAGGTEIVEQHRLAVARAPRRRGRCAGSRSRRPGRRRSRARRRRPARRGCCGGRTWSARCPGVASAGLRPRRTSSIVRISWLSPSSAKNSHCSGTSTASAAVMALRVSRPRPAGSRSARSRTGSVPLPRSSASRRRKSRRSAATSSISAPERSGSAGMSVRPGRAVGRARLAGRLPRRGAA